MKAEIQRQIEAAKHQVRRNLPAWPSSFGPCANECGRGKDGRGSGICLYCAMDDLAILIGKEAAEAYEAEIREMNRKERNDDEEDQAEIEGGSVRIRVVLHRRKGRRLSILVMEEA